jgi:hypothetical protein
VIQLDCFGLPDAASCRLSVYNSPKVMPATHPGSATVGCRTVPIGTCEFPPCWSGAAIGVVGPIGGISCADAGAHQGISRADDKSTSGNESRRLGRASMIGRSGTLRTSLHGWHRLRKALCTMATTPRMLAAPESLGQRK